MRRSLPYSFHHNGVSRPSFFLAGRIRINHPPLQKISKLQ